MFLSNNPSSGDINSSNLSCFNWNFTKLRHNNKIINAKHQNVFLKFLNDPYHLVASRVFFLFFIKMCYFWLSENVQILHQWEHPCPLDTFLVNLWLPVNPVSRLPLHLVHHKYQWGKSVCFLCHLIEYKVHLLHRKWVPLLHNTVWFYAMKEMDLTLKDVDPSWSQLIWIYTDFYRGYGIFAKSYEHSKLMRVTTVLLLIIHH